MQKYLPINRNNTQISTLSIETALTSCYNIVIIYKLIVYKLLQSIIVKHMSIRLAWHRNNWDGRIYNEQNENTIALEDICIPVIQNR